MDIVFHGTVFLEIPPPKRCNYHFAVRLNQVKKVTWCQSSQLLFCLPLRGHDVTDSSPNVSETDLSKEITLSIGMNTRVVRVLT